VRPITSLIVLGLLLPPESGLTQTRAGTVNVGDAEINYEITGQGKTVVFIHGWANTLAIWDNQVPFFSQRFQVLRYDRRGFGKSTGFADVSADPDDLRILLDRLGIASAYVVGLSAGSNVATRFAFAFPKRIDALVRVSGPPPEGLTIPGAGEGRANLVEIARKYGMDSLGKYVHAVLAFYPPGQSEAEARRQREASQKRWAEYSGRDLLDPRPESGRVPPARWDRIHTLSVPTLLVNGDHDRPIQLMVADSLARRLPNARKVVITDAGHGAHLNQPEQFSKALMAFFKEVDGRR
jgi:pimeloyl-ACP methyl ester carboxylesterase